MQHQMSDCPASCLSPVALRHSAGVKGYPSSVKQQANGKKTSLINQFISIMLVNVSLQPPEKENRKGYTGPRKQLQDGVHSTSAHEPSKWVNRIYPESPINVDYLLIEPNNLLFRVDKRGTHLSHASCHKIARKCHITAHPSTPANQKHILRQCCEKKNPTRTQGMSEQTSWIKVQEIREKKQNHNKPLYPESTTIILHYIYYNR